MTKALWRTAVATAWGLWVTTAPVMAQGTYPANPIRMIVGFAPGGSTDHVARLLAQDLG